MDEIFGNMFNLQSYQLKEASEEQIKLYSKAYKVFKSKNTETKAVIKLDLDTNTIDMVGFTGIEMYRFGYDVAKAE